LRACNQLKRVEKARGIGVWLPEGRGDQRLVNRGANKINAGGNVHRVTLCLERDAMIDAEGDLFSADKVATEVGDGPVLGAVQDKVRIPALGSRAVVANTNEDRRSGVLYHIGAQFKGAGRSGNALLL
jgi:hypothetical protein